MEYILMLCRVKTNRTKLKSFSVFSFLGERINSQNTIITRIIQYAVCRVRFGARTKSPLLYISHILTFGVDGHSDFQALQDPQRPENDLIISYANSKYT